MYHSYVMGVGSEICELESRGFTIETDGENFRVSFPAAKAQVWEEFIAHHLALEYWNEYLTETGAVFLFHLPEGMRRYDVQGFENDEVLALCEKLCACRFGSIRQMLTGNSFYSQFLSV